MPLLCNYYVTQRCNAKCKFCNIWCEPSNFHLVEASLDQIEHNLRDLRRLGVKIIDFTGGEPLLYPHLIAALRLAKKFGFYTTVTTNCSFYPNFAKELKGLVDWLFFSIQSDNADRHDAIVGIKSFAKVLASIDVSKKLRQKVFLLHTVTNENIDALPRMVAFAKKNRCPIRLNPCFSYFGNQELADKNLQVLRQYHNHPYVVTNLALLKFMAQGGNLSAKPLCQALKSVIVIGADNSLLLPCYHHSFSKIPLQNDLLKQYRGSFVQKMLPQVGRFDFCKGCKITCYMRASLLQRYPWLTLRSWYKSIREKARQQ